MQRLEQSMNNWVAAGKKVIDELKIALPQYSDAKGHNLPEMSLQLLCKHCGCTLCYVHSIYDLLCERGEEMEEEKCANRNIRFALYRIASEQYHGHLGKGNRKKLPTCIVGNIRDLFPDARRNYIGFRAKPEA